MYSTFSQVDNKIQHLPAFYNADLYEGLRATLNDARWMTEEEFAEVYGEF